MALLVFFGVDFLEVTFLVALVDFLAVLLTALEADDFLVAAFFFEEVVLLAALLVALLLPVVLRAGIRIYYHNIKSALYIAN